MSNDVIITVENLSKRYKLGTIGATTLRESVERAWHRLRGKDWRSEMGKIGGAAPRRAEGRKQNVKTAAKNEKPSTQEPEAGAESFESPQLSDFNPQPSSNDLWALRDVSFEVKRGEVLGVIGRNGAGKSTLLKILTRITEPTSGRAIMRGRVASLLEVGTGFHPELTGRENVYLNGAILGMKRTEITRKFDEIVAFAEVEKFIDTPVKRYSSGMYVRLAFAVAAHLDPEILLVDEVLAVGDMDFQKKCLGKMEDVARCGRTVLFVSHNMAAVGSLCGIGIFLKNGHIQTSGPAAHVIGQYVASAGTPRLSNAVIAESHDRRIQLINICCLTSTGQVRSVFRDDEDIHIHITYKLRLSTKGLALGINFQTELGILVLSSYLGDQRIEDTANIGNHVGVFDAQCILPGRLLNQLSYYIDVVFQIPGVAILLHEERASKLSIESTSRKIGGGVRPGVIRPQLQWENTYREE